MPETLQKEMNWTPLWREQLQLYNHPQVGKTLCPRAETQRATFTLTWAAFLTERRIY